MLENLLGVYTLAGMQAHDLIEQVYKLGVADPFVTTEVVAFLEYGNQVAQTLAKELILTSHDFSIVSTSDTEEAHVDPTVAIEHQNTALK